MYIIVFIMILLTEHPWINVTIGNNETTSGNSAKIIGEGEHQVKVRIKVYDKDNNPVQKASATLNGGGDLELTRLILMVKRTLSLEGWSRQRGVAMITLSQINKR